MLRKGWILTKDGKKHTVPEPLLDEETISWPFTLTEISHGGRVQYLSPDDLYRRHEIIPSQAYLYLQEKRTIGSVPEAVIRELLGPLAANRPTRFDVRPRDIALISNGIADRTLETHPDCVLVIPHGMWHDAAEATRTLFHNMCNIHNLRYRVERTGIGPAYWDCAPESTSRS